MREGRHTPPLAPPGGLCPPDPLIPPQLRDSNFGCVGGGDWEAPVWGWSCTRTARPPAARPAPGLCVFHTETLCVFHTETGVGPLSIIRDFQNSDLGQTIWSENIFWVILVSELRSRALPDKSRNNFSSRIQLWA